MLRPARMACFEGKGSGIRREIVFNGYEGSKSVYIVAWNNIRMEESEEEDGGE